MNWLFAIAASVLVGTSGALGVLLPGTVLALLAQRGEKLLATQAAHGFGAGVLLATALVHVLPTAQRMLAEGLSASDFPLSGFLALFAALFALLLSSSSSLQQQQQALLSGGSGGGGFVSSSIMRRGFARIRGWCAQKIGELRRVSAVEWGILLHSVILGMNLGVECAADELSSRRRTLLSALCVHQLLEGLALGASAQPARLTWSSNGSVRAFAVAAPGGVVLGLALFRALMGDSGAGRWTKVACGSLESLAGGVLVAKTVSELVSIISALSPQSMLLLPTSEKGRQQHLRSTGSTVFVNRTAFSIFLGAISMSLIGIWI